MKTTATTSLALSESQKMNTLASIERQRIDIKFRKRRIGLFRKAYMIGKLCDAHVCVILERNNDYFVYKSKDDPLWPPSLQNKVSFKLKFQSILTNYMKRNSRPLFVQKIFKQNAKGILQNVIILLFSHRDASYNHLN